MNIEMPQTTQPLRRLWKEAFGDEDDFLDGFFSSGFSPERCRCATENGKLLGALYWFDVRLQEQKYAYIYAVATAENSRGRGVCHALMAKTHSDLKAQGYSGSILVPQSEGLFRFYGGMGYVPCSWVREYVCSAGEASVPVRAVSAQEYAAQRRQLLPLGGIVQEGENLDFLQTQWKLYAGEDFLLTAFLQKDKLIAMEYLGDPSHCRGILRALNCSRGIFRMPGEDIPFAMYLPFEKGSKKPAYFGLAFD